MSGVSFSRSALRRRVSLVSITVAVVALAGCAGAQDDTSDAEQVTITVQQRGNWAPMMEPAVAKFEEEHPGVTVQLQTAADEGNDQVVTGANPPDVGWLNMASAAGKEAVKSGVIVDLESVWKNQDLDVRYGGNAKFLRSSEDGKAYSISPYAGYYGVVWYNKDLFDRWGVEVDDHRITEDQLQTVISKSRGEGLSPLAIGGSQAFVQGWMIDNILPTSADPDTLLEYKVGWIPAETEPDFAAPAFTDAVEQIKSWADDGLFQDGYLGQDLTTSEALWYQAQAAMTLGGSFTVAQLDTNGVTFNADWMFLPSVDPALSPYLQSYLGEALVVTEASEHQDLAKEFLETLMSDEIQTEITTSGFNLPAVNTVSVDSLGGVSELTKSLIQDANENGTALGWSAGGSTPPEVLDSYSPPMQNFLLGDGSVDDLVASVTQAYSELRAKD